MYSDLSTLHSPITNLFHWRLTPVGWAQYRLTNDQIEFFHTNGYLAGVRALNDEQIEALRNELAELVDPNHPGHQLFYEFHSNESTDPSTVLFHALGAWRISPAFHDLLWNPAVLMPASQLLGGAVRFWHDQLFCKPAHHGGVVAWHQDYSYWTRTQPMAHLSCWIGLDDSTIENGCVHYVPGSHRWSLLPVTGLANDMHAVQSVLTDEQKAQFKPVAIELKAGECSFHHPLMVHGSFENRGDRPRRGAVINVFRDGVRSASDHPLLEGVPPIPTGEKWKGSFFRCYSILPPLKNGNLVIASVSNFARPEETLMRTNALPGETDNSAKPNINVTPLIDVLLVMLIIFMVVSPLRPSRFLTKTASKPDQAPVEAPPLGLVVIINSDRSLTLNRTPDMGSVFDTAKLSAALVDVFEERLRNRAYRYELRDRADLPDSFRIEKTVFIKAPRALPYADVMRVLDAIKGAGASPVGLQIDDLN